MKKLLIGVLILSISGCTFLSQKKITAKIRDGKYSHLIKGNGDVLIESKTVFSLFRNKHTEGRLSDFNF